MYHWCTTVAGCRVATLTVIILWAALPCDEKTLISSLESKLKSSLTWAIGIDHDQILRNYRYWTLIETKQSLIKWAVKLVAALQLEEKVCWKQGTTGKGDDTDALHTAIYWKEKDSALVKQVSRYAHKHKEQRPIKYLIGVHATDERDFLPILSEKSFFQTSTVS